MRDVLVAVFWIWLLVALGVYAYRVYRRVAPGDRAEHEPPAGAVPPVALDPTTDTSAAGGPTGVDPTGIGGPASSPPPPPAPAPPPRGPSSAPARPAPAAPHQPAAPDPRPAEEEHDGRRGLFAPQAGSPSSRPTDDPTPGRPTVAEAVTGIALPCDLAPLVGGETRLDPYRVVFFTDRADAAMVGAGLGDELERLGYAVRSTSDHEAVALRDDVSLTVSIVTATDDFPTAPPGSVVVVLAT